MGKCVAAMDFKSVLEDDNWYNTHVNLSAVTDLPDDASAEDKKLAEAKVLRAEQDAKLGVMIMTATEGGIAEIYTDSDRHMAPDHFYKSGCSMLFELDEEYSSDPTEECDLLENMLTDGASANVIQMDLDTGLVDRALEFRGRLTRTKRDMDAVCNKEHPRGSGLRPCATRSLTEATILNHVHKRIPDTEYDETQLAALKAKITFAGYFQAMAKIDSARYQKGVRSGEVNKISIGPHENPKGKDGRVKMCNSCGSRAHLKADCPKKARKDARNPKELGLRRGGQEKKDCQRKEAKVGPVRDAMPRVDCWKLHVRR